MAYDTKTPASVALLVADILTFAAASGGMTLAAGGAGTSGAYTQYALQTSSGNYITLAHNTTEILLNTSTAWSKNTALISQTGACSVNAIYKTTATPVKAWLFADGYSVHVVTNPTAGAYQHCSFGVLEKFGTYTGGEYVAGTYWANATFSSSANFFPHMMKSNAVTAYTNHARATYAGRSVAANCSIVITGANNFVSGFAFGSGGAANAGAQGEPFNRQANSYNGRAVIMPHQYFLGYDIVSVTNPDGFIPIGKISNSGFINMENITAEDIVNTDWMAFPLCMKNPAAPVLASLEVDTGLIGLVYKK